MAKTIGCRAFDDVEELLQYFPLMSFELVYGIKRPWGEKRAERLRKRIQAHLDKFKFVRHVHVHSSGADDTGQRRVIINVDAPLNYEYWEHAPK